MTFGLAELQVWYLAQCDGDWEHTCGIKIETIDNPGWRLSVDLNGTELHGRSFERVEIARSQRDWVQAWVEDDRFDSACGPENLAEVIEVFGRFAHSAAER
ncbi:MAG TPA: immunity 53 family protein [Gaiellaceae bacterium]